MDSTLSVQSEQVTLAALAGRINAEHRAAEQALSAGLDHALRAGQLLTEAKGLCDHGQWLPWLESHFEGSARSARAYMLVAQRWPQLESKRQRAANLSLREALRITAEPKTEAAATQEPWDARLNVDEDFVDTMPELSPDRRWIGMVDEAAGKWVQIEPSTEHPGYYHLVYFEPALSDGSGYVTWDSKPCKYTRRLLAWALSHKGIWSVDWVSAPALPQPPYPIETGTERMMRVIREAHEKHGRN